MNKKTEYEKGWYDCYKSVRALLNGTMKEMVAYRAPGAEKARKEVPGASISARARRRGNGKARAQAST